jgi:hypothetical protein
MKTLPSSAYTVFSLPIRHAMVVNRLFFDGTGSVPVLISMKLPVPYVFLAIPGLVQTCPKRADC